MRKSVALCSLFGKPDGRLASLLLISLTGLVLLNQLSWAKDPAGRIDPGSDAAGLMNSDPVVNFSAVTENSASGSYTPATLTAGVYQADYVLEAGDQVNVEDGTMGQLATYVRILDDGSLYLPLVGKVYLGGMSVADAQELVNHLYRHYYKHPLITVSVAYQHPIRVYVSGAVKAPGFYVSGKQLQPEQSAQAFMGHSYSQDIFSKLYLTDALVMAGGITFNANATDIKITRQYPRPQVLHVNIMDLMHNGNASQDIALRDHDQIEVSEVPKESVVMDDNWNSLMRNNFALGVYRVNVIGAVEHPGSYEVEANDGLIKVLAQAGGFSTMADPKKVYILRANSAGQLFKKQIDLSTHKLVANGDGAVTSVGQTSMLLPNDVILVDESRSKKAANIATNVLNQVSSAVSQSAFYRLFTFIDFTPTK